MADTGERGVVVKNPGAAPGYVLFSPILSDTTYLVDQDGLVVHTWKSDYAPGSAVYLLDNGNLLRGAREPDVPVFTGGGQGGRIQQFTWDGELVWDYLLADETRLQHHDVELLPNGNILTIAWEAKTADEARLAGRRPDLLPEQGLWPDMVLELEPIRPNGANIVWEWHVWDHLVQNRSRRLANYGEPAEHPHRIDVNGDGALIPQTEEELEKLKALGYLSVDAKPEDIRPDMLHTNSIDYHPERDQIILSTPHFHEVWIIDHSTTPAEAASSEGGRWGRGGDLLYRWGNPRAYDRGDASVFRLGAQHDASFIPAGYPGAGNVLIFNNRVGGPEGKHSSVVEIAPPVDADSRYVVPALEPFGPAEPVWIYEDPETFSAPFISGAHRLPNGNTFITSGPDGRFFEVTPAGEIVWDYRSPYSGDVRNPDGTLPQPGLDKLPRAVFRATKIALDHPALAGRELEPLNPQPPWPEEKASGSS